jgi:hypothetical protein
MWPANLPRSPNGHARRGVLPWLRGVGAPCSQVASLLISARSGPSSPRRPRPLVGLLSRQCGSPRSELAIGLMNEGSRRAGCCSTLASPTRSQRRRDTLDQSDNWRREGGGPSIPGVSARRSGWPGRAGNGARHGLFPQVSEALTVVLVKAREEHLAHGLMVRGLRLAQAREPVARETD